MESQGWHVSMFGIHLGKLLWMYYHRHARMRANNRADKLAGTAIITSGLRLRISEVLWSLRHHQRAQSQGHHTINLLEKRSVESGSARRSSVKGRETVIVKQTNNGTALKVTLGKLARHGVERIWAFPNA